MDGIAAAAQLPEEQRKALEAAIETMQVKDRYERNACM